MTREELKKHCLRQVEACEIWAKYNGEEPHGKVYEEHKLILELLEQEPCEDCISREKLDKALYENFHEEDSPNNITDVRLSAVRNFIRNFPSINPQESKLDTLDKVRAEIRDWQRDIHDNEYDAETHDFVFERIYEIIDELKTESENKE